MYIYSVGEAISWFFLYISSFDNMIELQLHLLSNCDQSHSNSPLIAWFPTCRKSRVWGTCGLRHPQQMVLDQILEAAGQRGRLAESIMSRLGDVKPSRPQRCLLCQAEPLCVPTGLLGRWCSDRLLSLRFTNTPFAGFLSIQECVSSVWGFSWFDDKWLDYAMSLVKYLGDNLNPILLELQRWHPFLFFFPRLFSIVAMTGGKTF